jgi:hypothetical protein
VSIADATQLMSDGHPVPHAFDGMCALPAAGGKVRLIRNHEDRESPGNYRPPGPIDLATGLPNPIGFLNGQLGQRGPRANAYDDYAAGGCTAVDVKFTKNGVPETLGQHWALVGSTINCAGGVTPWGTWITCEEGAASSSATGFTQNHGYCFEVRGDTSPGQPTGWTPGNPAGKPVALTGLGRLVHEAVAVDPDTCHIYETEDNGSSSGSGGDCGFYRWEPSPLLPKPTAFGHLDAVHAAGTLKMLKVIGSTNERLYEDTVPGTSYTCEWKTITTTNCFASGKAQGCAIFKKLEGCWYDPATKKVFFVASGDAGHGLGQVWSYDTVTNVLTLIYAPNGVTDLDNPDNVCVSPRGGLVLCEDSGGAQMLKGLSTTGQIFDLARNVFSENEFAGACFSPDGKYLFVNIFGLSSVRAVGKYKPVNLRESPTVFGPDQNQASLTLAIWGDWARAGTGCI